MSAGFAGGLRHRVVLSRPSGAQDRLGAAQGWTEIGLAWAEVRPEGRGALFVGEARSGLLLWRVTLRARDIAVGDRIEAVGRTMIVREVLDDPALPDRVVTIAEEGR